MAQELYSVEKVAEMLGLHVRTVRNYVREGRLKAVRIGKQYRINREDLEELLGRPVGEVERPVSRQRSVEVSSVVEIAAIDREETMRLTNTVLAVAGGHDRSEGPLRVDTIYDEQRALLKLIVFGSLETSAQIMRLIALVLESPR